MSLSLEVLNKNTYRNATTTTAKQIMEGMHPSVNKISGEQQSNTKANVDSFVYSGGKTECGAYSKSMAMHIPLEVSSASKVQAKGAKGASNVYLNVITHRAAKRAGISVGTNGQPRISGSNDYTKYNNAKRSIEETYWCQTGEWENLSGDGSQECARTALATMASINSDSVVTPNKTTANMNSVRVYGYPYPVEGGYSYNYNAVNGSDIGCHTYGFKNESDLLEAINTELSQKRSVEVKVTTKATERMHWVTITGTKDGKQAKSFRDLMGVDPWYNGENIAHGGHRGTGKGSTESSNSGVIRLSTTCSGFRYTNEDDDDYPEGYRMVTFNVDN
jgi:hypothetical protein